MTALLAEFATPEALAEAAASARRDGFPVLDALSPYPVPAFEAVVGTPPPALRGAMAAAGFGVAIAAFAFQAWTSVVAYPVNEGGRPLFSWPVFLLVPFEVGVLAAAVAGFVMFLWRCGLPRLHHPLFDVPGIERASQDRFFLLLDSLDAGEAERLRGLLFAAGAHAVSEARP